MVCSVQRSMCSMKCTCVGTGASACAGTMCMVDCALYHGLAIYTEVTFVSVILVEVGPSGGGPAVV